MYHKWRVTCRGRFKSWRGGRHALVTRTREVQHPTPLNSSTIFSSISSRASTFAFCREQGDSQFTFMHVHHCKLASRKLLNGVASCQQMDLVRRFELTQTLHTTRTLYKLICAITMRKSVLYLGYTRQNMKGLTPFRPQLVEWKKISLRHFESDHPRTTSQFLQDKCLRKPAFSKHPSTRWTLQWMHAAQVIRAN